ncbi:C39 family peptidase [Flavobacterium sp. HJJ]|uniref:C39 family peptidase n=1 Tax=Flavobacterium sp. HJJ TaxID=2783792 RepID=UPI00188B85E9|nr:papain-like cysteine protease family protein [Flavobacterium sp. HJJ]MBF4473054.1 C39 family peptidase [Flavobacterium sp. HJJ]
MITSTVSFGQQTGEVYQFPDGSYCAAIKSDIFQYYAARQEYDNWCWAACIQMVLNYQGIKVSQDNIVIKAFGQLVNRGADCYVMTNAANGWNYNGTTLEAWQESSPSASDLINALAYKYPVVIGLNMPGQNMGHAYVLTAIYYTRNSNGTKIPYKVTLRDPWPTNPSKKELSWSDFTSRINCIVHVTH